jgi:hypothetical protein
MEDKLKLIKETFPEEGDVTVVVESLLTSESMNKIAEEKQRDRPYPGQKRRVTKSMERAKPKEICANMAYLQQVQKAKLNLKNGELNMVDPTDLMFKELAEDEIDEEKVIGKSKYASSKLGNQLGGRFYKTYKGQYQDLFDIGYKYIGKKSIPSLIRESKYYKSQLEYSTTTSSELELDLEMIYDAITLGYVSRLAEERGIDLKIIYENAEPNEMLEQYRAIRKGDEFREQQRESLLEGDIETARKAYMDKVSTFASSSDRRDERLAGMLQKEADEGRQPFLFAGNYHENIKHYINPGKYDVNIHSAEGDLYQYEIEMIQTIRNGQDIKTIDQVEIDKAFIMDTILTIDRTMSRDQLDNLREKIEAEGGDKLVENILERAQKIGQSGDAEAPITQAVNELTAA